MKRPDILTGKVFTFSHVEMDYFRDIEKYADHLEDQLAVTTRERDALARWKQEALQVEAWWNEIDAFIRKHPDAMLGSMVSDNALAWLKERDELKADLTSANFAAAGFKRAAEEWRAYRKRLDWLTGNGYACIVHWTHGAGNRWFLMDPATGSRLSAAEYDTANAAIDAAMSGPNPPVAGEGATQ